MLQYPYVHSSIKNIKKFASKILKRTLPGKPYAEEARRNEIFVNTNIEEKHNVTPKNSPVDYTSF